MEFSIIFFRLVCLGALALFKLKCEMPWFCVPEHWFVLNWAIKYQKKIGVNLGEAFLNVSTAGQYSVLLQNRPGSLLVQRGWEGEGGHWHAKYLWLAKNRGRKPSKKTIFLVVLQLGAKGHLPLWLLASVQGKNTPVVSGWPTPVGVFRCWNSLQVLTMNLRACGEKCGHVIYEIEGGEVAGEILSHLYCMQCWQLHF